MGKIPPPTPEELIEDSVYARLTERIIGAAIEVHRQLGPGLTEAPYREALCIELRERGHDVVEKHHVPLRYKGRPLRSHYEIDLLVDDTIVIELKAVETLIEAHKAQAVSYLKATRKPIGLVMNFRAPTLVQGLARVANTAVLQTTL